MKRRMFSLFLAMLLTVNLFTAEIYSAGNPRVLKAVTATNATFEDSFGESGLSFDSFTEGEVPSIDCHAKTMGYTFAGWFSAEGTKLAAASQAEDGSTYSAKWKNSFGNYIVTGQINLGEDEDKTKYGKDNTTGTGITYYEEASDDYEANTLVLDGATIDCMVQGSDRGNISLALTEIDNGEKDPVTLVVERNSAVYSPDTEGDQGYSGCICSFASLTVKGEGTLTVKSGNSQLESVGIMIYIGSLINSGTISCESGDAVQFSLGLVCEKELVNSGNITASTGRAMMTGGLGGSKITNEKGGYIYSKAGDSSNENGASIGIQIEDAMSVAEDSYIIAACGEADYSYACYAKGTVTVCGTLDLYAGGAADGEEVYALYHYSGTASPLLIEGEGKATSDGEIFSQTAALGGKGEGIIKVENGTENVLFGQTKTVKPSGEAGMILTGAPNAPLFLEPTENRYYLSPIETTSRGYIVEGWYDSEGGKYDPKTSEANGKEYTAKLQNSAGKEPVFESLDFTVTAVAQQYAAGTEKSSATGIEWEATEKKLTLNGATIDVKDQPFVMKLPAGAEILVSEDSSLISDCSKSSDVINGVEASGNLTVSGSEKLSIKMYCKDGATVTAAAGIVSPGALTLDVDHLDISGAFIYGISAASVTFKSGKLSASGSVRAIINSKGSYEGILTVSADAYKMKAGADSGSLAEVLEYSGEKYLEISTDTVFDDCFGGKELSFDSFVKDKVPAADCYAKTAGYMFAGWFTEEGEELTSAENALKGVTYRAGWKNSAGNYVVTEALNFNEEAVRKLYGAGNETGTGIIFYEEETVVDSKTYAANTLILRDATIDVFILGSYSEVTDYETYKALDTEGKGREVENAAALRLPDKGAYMEAEGNSTVRVAVRGYVNDEMQSIMIYKGIIDIPEDASLRVLCEDAYFFWDHYGTGILSEPEDISELTIRNAGILDIHSFNSGIRGSNISIENSGDLRFDLENTQYELNTKYYTAGIFAKGDLSIENKGSILIKCDVDGKYTGSSSKGAKIFGISVVNCFVNGCGNISLELTGRGDMNYTIYGISVEKDVQVDNNHLSVSITTDSGGKNNKIRGILSEDTESYLILGSGAIVDMLFQFGLETPDSVMIQSGSYVFVNASVNLKGECKYGIAAEKVRFASGSLTIQSAAGAIISISTEGGAGTLTDESEDSSISILAGSTAKDVVSVKQYSGENYLHISNIHTSILVLTQSRIAGTEVSAALVSGGEDTVSESGALLTAPEEVAGYSFKGWFRAYSKEAEGEPVSRNGCIRVFDSGTYTAVYEADPDEKLCITLKGCSFSVSGAKGGLTSASTDEITVSLKAGTEVTAKCTEDDFLYWADDNGNCLSKSSAYTFTVVRPVSIHPVTEKKEH